MSTFTSRTPSEHWVEGSGGRLFVRHWPAAGTATASLVICHGFKAHSGHYARSAEVFAARGIAVTAADLRGRGHSEGERYYVETFADYVSDLAAATAFARAEAPDLPLFVLGHSAGGVIAASYAIDHPDAIAGLICESFAYQVFAPKLAILLLRAASHVVPGARAVRLNPANFSRDPAWVEALRADPLVRDEVEPVATMAALARAGQTLGTAFPRFTVPLLVLHGTADKATKPEGSRAFHQAAGSADKTLKLYEGHAHDLLNDLGRDRVTNDIGNWVAARAHMSVSITPPSTRNAAPVVAEASGEAR